MNFFKKLKTLFQNHSNLKAIEDSKKIYTYLELLSLVEKYADVFGYYFKTNKRVAFCIEPCSELIIFLLAVWKAGGTVILLDSKIPKVRLKTILELTSVDLVFLNKEDFDKIHYKNKFLIEEFLLFTPSSKKVFSSKISLNQPAYIVFTSGTTGLPKGVIIPHEGIFSVIEYQAKVFEMNKNSRTLSFLSVGFDAFFSELLTTLFSGACYVIDPELRRSKEILFSKIESLEITHAFLPPAILTSFLGQKVPPSLKVVVTGGEVCPKTTVLEWVKHVKLISAYGPTEATICSHLAICHSNWKEPVLGELLPQRKQRILFSKGSSAGELLLGGVGLALGYFNDEKETKKKFIELDGERWYKTGDKVRVNSKGELIFEGRIDRQWKLRGNRIEAEEIETIARKMKNVGMLQVYLIDEKIILAYTSQEEISKQNWKEFFFRYLETYKIPSEFVYLENVILNSNGKWDITENFKQVKKKLFYKNSIEEDSISTIKNFLKRNDSRLKKFQEDQNFKTTVKVLNEEVNIFFNLKQNQKTITKSNKVLVLGGSGFLGSFFLKEILQEKEVILLSRNPFVREKLFTNPIFKNEKNLLRKLQIFVSYPAKKNFGLSQKNYSSLSNISEIFNLAGSTNAFLSRKELENPNIQIVKNCIQFSYDYPNVKIHHISTLSIFLHSSYQQKQILESSQLTDENEIYGGYAQSKYIAERLLQKYVKNYTIYRLGLLVPDTKFGILNEKDFFTFFIKNFYLWKDLKTSVNLEMDFLPVDIAAKLIFYFSHLENKIVHIHGLESLTLHDLQMSLPSNQKKVFSRKYETEYVEFLIQNFENPTFLTHPLQLFLKTNREFITETFKLKFKACFVPKQEVLEKIWRNLF